MDDYGDGEYYADCLYEARMCEEYNEDCENCPCRYECDDADFG